MSSKKLITEKAKGNFVLINKKKFFDLSMHSGVLLLGHNHKIFRTTLNDLKKNYSITNFQNQDIRDKILKYIKKYFKSAHDLIFCTTGSETVIKAIRISRAINNKSKIFIVSGSWHGSVDQTLYFSKENLKPIPLSSGINDDVKKNTIILPYNDIEKSKKILNKNYKEASCILIEPITASLPLEKSKYYLKFLREYSLKKRITLIFDEMVTGIRTEKGSVQNRFNIYPDITLAGKAIGGGLPISLIIINKKIFNKIKKLKKKIFFGGTFSGNNFSLISCLNTLSYVNKNKNLLRGIINKSKVIQDKLNNFLIKNNLDVKIYRFDTFLRIVFSKTSINNRIARDFFERKNKIRITKFTKYLYTKKILYPKNGIIFFSATLTSNNVDYLVKNLSTALKKCFK